MMDEQEQLQLVDSFRRNPKPSQLDMLATQKQNEARQAATKLKRATAFVLVFFFVEIVGGYIAGSLAIMTDAAHLLTDVSSFILAIVANEIASRPACEKLTYGPVRAEVLSALASTILILILSGVLIYEAIVRIVEISEGDGEEIDGKLMSFVASLGLVVNIVLLILLKDNPESSSGFGGHDHGHGHAHPKELSTKYLSIDTSDHSESHDHDHDHDHSHDHSEHNDMEHGSKKKIAKRNLNLEAAVVHAVTDLVQSAGVLLAGLLIWWKPNWKIVDPIVTIFFVILVLNYTRFLLSHALNVLLEGVPEAFSYAELKDDLMAIEGVSDVHCLHIWSLTLGRIVVTAHLKASDPDAVLLKAHTHLKNMGVVHSTIQIQRDDCDTQNCLHPCVSTTNECCN